MRRTLSARGLLVAIPFFGVLACEPATQRTQSPEGNGGPSDADSQASVSPGGQWSSVALTEVTRIGQRDGPEDYLFARIDLVSATKGGNVFIYDGRLERLRIYTHDGRYLRDVGGLGSGPGEYRRITGMEVLDDGSLAIWDPVNHRISLYNSDATFQRAITVALGSSSFAPNSFVVGQGGTFYILSLARGGKAVYLRVGPEGIVDTVLVPADRLGEPQAILQPGLVWALRGDGTLFSGEGDTYKIERQVRGRSKGAITRTTAPVQLNRAELAEYEAINTWIAERMPPARGNGARNSIVPRVWPFFSGIKIARDGRLWVLREVGSHKMRVPPPPRAATGMPTMSWEPERSYDVFSFDGQFLGSTRVPDKCEILSIDGDEIWGSVEGDDDAKYVVRFVLKTA